MSKVIRAEVSLGQYFAGNTLDEDYAHMTYWEVDPDSVRAVMDTLFVLLGEPIRALRMNDPQAMAAAYRAVPGKEEVDL